MSDIWVANRRTMDACFVWRHAELNDATVQHDPIRTELVSVIDSPSKRVADIEPARHPNLSPATQNNPLFSLKCLHPGSGRKIPAIWHGAGVNPGVFIPET